MLIASEGSIQPPKTEINVGDREDSIGNENSPPQNGRYDIQSNNERLSGMEKSPDASNHKLSKQIHSSNNVSGN